MWCTQIPKIPDVRLENMSYQCRCLASWQSPTLSAAGHASNSQNCLWVSHVLLAFFKSLRGFEFSQCCVPFRFIGVKSRRDHCDHLVGPAALHRPQDAPDLIPVWSVYILREKAFSLNISRRICHDIRQVIWNIIYLQCLKCTPYFWHELAWFQHSALGFCCALLDWSRHP